MSDKKLILASKSPARKDILLQVTKDFVVEPSNFEEDMSLPMDPPQLAIFLSRGKARDVAKKHSEGVILGADSFAVLGDQPLGKPNNTDRARQMLLSLSGKCHSFITGFTIVDAASKKEYSDSVQTVVYFRKLTKAEIDNYLSKENVNNNAGAYIIQGAGGALVDKIDGDYTNVMGLPLSKIVVALRAFGIDLLYSSH